MRFRRFRLAPISMTLDDLELYKLDATTCS